MYFVSNIIALNTQTGDSGHTIQTVYKFCKTVCKR